MLRAEGHEITFLTGSVFRDRIEDSGAKFVSLPPGVDFDGRDILLGAPELKNTRRDSNGSGLLSNDSSSITSRHSTGACYRQYRNIGPTLSLATICSLASCRCCLDRNESDLPSFSAVHPALVHFVGAPPIVPGQAPLSALAHDLDGSRQVVLVTQGTVANHNFGLLIAPTLAALGDEPDVLVVATTGATVYEERSDAAAIHVRIFRIASSGSATRAYPRLFDEGVDQPALLRFFEALLRSQRRS